MAQQKDTAIYRNISPLVQQQIDYSISNNASSGLSSSASLAGALLANGTVSLNGNLSVGTGVTIDGVDIDAAISALQSSVAAVEAFAYSGLGLSNTDTGTTYTLILTSSSNPGAAASILASNSSGGIQLVRIGLGTADSTTAPLHVLSTTTQARISYDATLYTNISVNSSGEFAIATSAAGSNIYVIPTGNLGINMATAPAAKTEIRHTGEQLRLSYSGAVYGSHTISSAGNYTIASTGGNLYTTNHVAHPSYVSQLTAWRISSAGEADFRYIYTDELHAKAFIADLEQALAGGQIISKSVAKVYAAFTVPTAGNTGNLDVEEFAGFAAFHVFVDGDLVRLRQFDRSGGGLKIADIWGTVVYSAQVSSSNPPAQRYIFTRHATYPGTGSGTISAGTLVLDYGTTGNGYLEQNAIDGSAGANSPYYQIVTWATHPKSVTANQGLQLRVRLGQLRGLTGNNQWGLYAGTGWTAIPNEGNVTSYSVTTPAVDDAHRYILAGDNGVNIYNADLTIYSSTTPVISLLRTAPSIAVGSSSDTITYSAGAAGFWVGNDSGTYKMRLGSVSGGALTAGLSWDGSILRVMGSAYIGNGVGFSVAPLIYCAFDTPQGSTVPNLNGHLGQVPTYSGPITGTSTGKYHGALYLEEFTTNLITNNSFETNTTGVTANGGTISRVNTFSYDGSWSLRCTAATGSFGWYYDVAGVTSASTQYTWSVYMRGTGNVRLFAYGASGYISTSAVTLTTTWTRYSLTFTYSTGTTRLVGVEQNGAGTTDWNTDATQLEQKAYITSWIATTRAVAMLYYPAANNFNATTGTLSGWVYLSPLSGRTATFFGGDNTGSLTVYCNATTIIVSRKDVANVATYSVALSANTWYHVAATWSGGTVTKLYLNGALVGSGTAGSAYATPTSLVIGNYDTAGTFNINGYIDDVACIGRVLSADEIASIYASTAPLNVTHSNYELMLANTSTAGYVVGNASGLFGYSDNTGAAGTGAFALVTTASTALGTAFGSITLDAGDVIFGNASSANSNVLFDKSAGRLMLRNGTTERLVVNSDGAIGIKDPTGATNVLLFSPTVNQILGRLDLASGGSITAGASFDDVILDSTGLVMKAPTAYAAINSMRWLYSSTKVGEMYAIVDTGAPVSGTLVLRGRTYSGGSNGFVDIGASSSSGVAVQTLWIGYPNTSTVGPSFSTRFYNTSAALISHVVSGGWVGANQGILSSIAATYGFSYRIVIRNTSTNTTTYRSGNVAAGGTDGPFASTSGADTISVLSDGNGVRWARAGGSSTYTVTMEAIIL